VRAALAPVEVDLEALQELCKGAMWRFSSSLTTKADWAGGTFAARVGAPGQASGSEAGSASGGDSDARLRRVWEVIGPPSRQFALAHIQRSLAPRPC
jgi:hypothetical protein